MTLSSEGLYVEFRVSLKISEYLSVLWRYFGNFWRPSARKHFALQSKRLYFILN